MSEMGILPLSLLGGAKRRYQFTPWGEMGLLPKKRLRTTQSSSGAKSSPAQASLIQGTSRNGGDRRAVSAVVRDLVVLKGLHRTENARAVVADRVAADLQGRAPASGCSTRIAVERHDAAVDHRGEGGAGASDRDASVGAATENAVLYIGVADTSTSIHEDPVRVALHFGIIDRNISAGPAGWPDQNASVSVVAAVIGDVAVSDEDFLDASRWRNGNPVAAAPL
jgi:hypothetical protein